MKLYFYLLVVLLCAQACGYQKQVLQSVNQRFPDAAGKMQKVSKGIYWYAWLGEDTVLQRKESINAVVIDLKKADVTFDFAWFNTPETRNVVSYIADTALAIVAVNSGYFENLKDGGYVSFHKSKGQVNQTVTLPQDHIRYWKHQAAFVQTGPKSFDILQGDLTAYEKLPYPNIVSSAPALILDGNPVGRTFVKMKTGDKSKLPGEYPERHQAGNGNRMAFGITTRNQLIFIAVDGRSKKAEGINAEELTNLLYNHFKANEAINMDGGGSLSMFVRGATPTGIVNYPSDNRKADPNRFDHVGQRKIGMALLVLPRTKKEKQRMKNIKVMPDTEAKDYLDNQ